MPLSPKDIENVRAHGLKLEEIQRQEKILREPLPPPILDRPCVVGDGILRLQAEEISATLSFFDRAREEGRLSKFIPASGAASRMFQALAAYRGRRPQVLRDPLKKEADGGDPEAGEVLRFVQNLPRFPFFDALQAKLREKGGDPSALFERGTYTPWIDALLSTDGLNLAAVPKALMPFHRVKDHIRTPLEEHLIDSVDTLRSGEGLCRLHFTVSPEHAPLFRDRLAEILPRLEKDRRCRFDVTFSEQASSTDTISLGPDGFPARLKDGRLLFRPGGHGALLGNLNALEGDVVFIKNIDNVPDEFHPGESSHWDALLAGLLLDLQFHLFQRTSWLTGRPNDIRILDEAEEFAGRRLNIHPPAASSGRSVSRRREWLLSRFRRPLRVCAVVKNTGEPGGAPFWVTGSDGEVAPQIVEAAHVSDEPSQRKIFQSSTHFNPVHMVCGLRNGRGECYDLAKFIDPDAAFVTEKSVEGKSLKVLERPGLWNGSMSRWTTVFVEVPLSTFHPVKTVNDLLREDRQP